MGRCSIIGHWNAAQGLTDGASCHSYHLRGQAHTSMDSKNPAASSSEKHTPPLYVTQKYEGCSAAELMEEFGRAFFFFQGCCPIRREARYMQGICSNTKMRIGLLSGCILHSMMIFMQNLKHWAVQKGACVSHKCMIPPKKYDGRYKKCRLYEMDLPFRWKGFSKNYNCGYCAIRTNHHSSRVQNKTFGRVCLCVYTWI